MTKMYMILAETYNEVLIKLIKKINKINNIYIYLGQIKRNTAANRLAKGNIANGA